MKIRKWKIFKEYNRRTRKIQEAFGKKSVLLIIGAAMVAYSFSGMIFGFVQTNPEWIARSLTGIFNIIFFVIFVFVHIYGLANKMVERGKSKDVGIQEKRYFSESKPTSSSRKRYNKSRSGSGKSSTIRKSKRKDKEK